MRRANDEDRRRGAGRRGKGGGTPRKNETVAYFGPAPPHDRMLRRSGVHVRGLDFFYPGYEYDIATTESADLSGKTCGGGWGNAAYDPE